MPRGENSVWTSTRVLPMVIRVKLRKQLTNSTIIVAEFGRESELWLDVEPVKGLEEMC